MRYCGGGIGRRCARQTQNQPNAWVERVRHARCKSSPAVFGDLGLQEREGTRESEDEIKMQRSDGPVTGRRTETGDYIKGNAGGEKRASG